MTQYYLAKGTERLGPFTVEQLLSNGLMPDSLVWTQGMPGWAKAAEVPELMAALAPPAPAPAPPAPPVPPVQPQPAVVAAPVAPQAPAAPAAPQSVAPQPVPQPQAPQYTAPQPQPQAPQYTAPRPQWQQPGQQVPPPQQPWQQPMPAKHGVDQNVFKIILYVLLGLSGLGAVFTFFGSFAYFGGWFNKPLLGICQILMSAAIIGIVVLSFMRMIKNEKFGFITIGYFAVAFILNLLGLIVASGYGGYGGFSFFTGISGLAIAVLASIPFDKITDVNSYKQLLKEAQPIDYVLLGVYALMSIITLISIMTLMKSLRSFNL